MVKSLECLIRVSTMQMTCRLLFRKPSGCPTKQESHRISISISDKSLFPSALASPAVLRSRQCWAVMSGQCLRVSLQRSADRHRGQDSWISLGPPAASFTCHEDEDRTGPCSVSFKRLRNSLVRVWSVLFKHLQTHSVNLEETF